MQSQKNLCICLDTNKKSLFASKFIYKYSPQPKGSNVLLHYFDMSKGLLQLLNTLSSRCHLPIIVLFQHPSPSPEKTSRNAIATASKDCMHALVSGYIEEIHYVFDYNPSKNTWSGDKLQALTHSLCEKHIIDNTCSSHIQTISQNGDETVHHPIFGVVNRRGWALMKKGHEMAFVITKTKIRISFINAYDKCCKLVEHCLHMFLGSVLHSFVSVVFRSCTPSWTAHCCTMN